MQVLSFISFPKWLNPEIIQGLPLRWYGLMYLVAFFVAYQMVRIQVKEKALEVQKDDVLNMFFWGIVGLLVGARLFAVTIYAPAGEYLRQPWKIILPVAIENGKLRFTVGTGSDEVAGLTLIDPDGKLRFAVAAFPDGSAHLQLIDHNGKSRFAVVTFPDGRARLQLADLNDKARFAVVTNSDEGAGLMLYDSNGKVIWSKISASNP